MQPNHPTQIEIFQKKYFSGSFLTIEVSNVDEEYERLKKLACEIVLEIKDEIWGDRHFVIKDPNGLGIDLVTYSGGNE